MKFILFLKELVGAIFISYFLFCFVVYPIIRTIFLGIFFPTEIDPTIVLDITSGADTVSNLEIEPKKDISSSLSQKDKDNGVLLFLGAFLIFGTVMLIVTSFK